MHFSRVFKDGWNEFSKEQRCWTDHLKIDLDQNYYLQRLELYSNEEIQDLGYNYIDRGHNYKNWNCHFVQKYVKS